MKDKNHNTVGMNTVYNRTLMEEVTNPDEAFMSKKDPNRGTFADNHKTITIEKNLYRFTELENKAKNRAIIDYLSTLDPDVFAENIEHDLDHDYGLGGLKTYYSLSYGQGDGLCLYGEISDYEILDNAKFNFVLDGISADDAEYIRGALFSVEFEHKGGSFNYHKTSVNINANIDDDCDDKQHEIINTIMENIRKWYLDVCDKFAQMGHAYFYEIDEITFEEMCEGNDWWFEKDGAIYWE